MLERWKSLVGEEELEGYEKAGMGRRMGFGKKPAILIIDMTYLFVDSAYSLSSTLGDRGWKAVKAVSKLLNAARQKNIPLFFSKRASQTLPAEKGTLSLKFEKLEWTFDERADQWPPEITPADKDVIIPKTKPSLFFETPLRSMLTYFNIDTVIVTGITTSGCVRATVEDACSCNYRVIIPEECVADRSLFAHSANLFDMDMKFADVISLDEVLAYIRGL